MGFHLPIGKKSSKFSAAKSVTVKFIAKKKAPFNFARHVLENIVNTPANSSATCSLGCSLCHCSVK